MINQTELNVLLQIAIEKVEALGIKVGNIQPTVLIKDLPDAYGLCERLDDYFTITINKYFLKNPISQVYNTVVHEVLHTVNGGIGHNKTWKELAQLCNRVYGYNIEVASSHNLDLPRDIYKYKILCDSCNYIDYRKRASKLVKEPELFRCHCGGRVRVEG